MKKILLSTALENKPLYNCFVNHVELFEFNYFELIYYTVRQSLLQIRKNVSKWDNFITKQCKHYLKVG